ncbi:uncharacterized protein HD556DRAFT_1304200 [Suillus plorans]|uniref:Uncharacterized protein n=1 Tax=Suillus plorans TaxID=116603 RepID=A0A9P7J3X8_9AGAM|nr:uncharacterized protein HD556DRAFT_1304200 [Suillus plorans]KAG1802000.1 hypothetical protein HD556DRAFT_1304200 [Suillus plorans]
MYSIDTVHSSYTAAKNRVRQYNQFVVLLKRDEDAWEQRLKEAGYVVIEQRLCRVALDGFEVEDDEQDALLKCTVDTVFANFIAAQHRVRQYNQFLTILNGEEEAWAQRFQKASSVMPDYQPSATRHVPMANMVMPNEGSSLNARFLRRPLLGFRTEDKKQTKFSHSYYYYPERATGDSALKWDRRSKGDVGLAGIYNGHGSLLLGVLDPYYIYRIATYDNRRMITTSHAPRCSWERDTDFRGLSRHRSICRHYRKESTLATERRRNRAQESVQTLQRSSQLATSSGTPRLGPVLFTKNGHLKPIARSEPMVFGTLHQPIHPAITARASTPTHMSNFDSDVLDVAMEDLDERGYDSPVVLIVITNSHRSTLLATQA